MKVVTVVGARPQFIKAAVVSPALRQQGDEVLVHTGQHYDRLLSEIFFEELQIPLPDYDLGIGSDSHGIQTGKMLERLDPILSRERPDVVMVYGDTNSTLAGALAAAKLAIPVAHVEAGLRSFNRAMPEEINRVLTDHVASRLYCPTSESVANLSREGIRDGVILTGDVMDVAVRRASPDPDILERLLVQPGQYLVATVHRQENTDMPTRLKNILQALGSMPWTVVLVLHPRTGKRIREYGFQSLLSAPSIRTVEPLGYRSMIALTRLARAVLTDSGGLQREASALGVPTYILREETEWMELVQQGRSVLVGSDPDRIIQAVIHGAAVPLVDSGDTDPVSRIVEDLVDQFGR